MWCYRLDYTFDDVLFLLCFSVDTAVSLASCPRLFVIYKMCSMCFWAY